MSAWPIDPTVRNLVASVHAVSSQAVRDAADGARLRADDCDDVATALDPALLRLADGWRGEAADAAVEELRDLIFQGRRLGRAYSEAADALTECATGLESARALADLAQRMERLDAEAKRVSAGARGPAGPTSLLAPWQEQTPWQDQTPTLMAARSLAAQAAGDHADALRRAVSVLQGLASTARAEPAPTWRRLTLADQLKAVPVGAYRSIADSVSFGLSLAPIRILTDRQDWVRSVEDIGVGVGQMVQNPVGAAKIMLGIDLLENGQYGEWVGGFLPDAAFGLLTGGAVPLTRRGTVVAHELSRVAEKASLVQQMSAGTRLRPEAGGLVVPRDGAVLAPGLPSRIADLSASQRSAILSRRPVGPVTRRDRGGFPADWSDSDVIAGVMDAARHPERGERSNGTYVVTAIHRDVTVRVVLKPDGTVMTARAVKNEPPRR